MLEIVRERCIVSHKSTFERNIELEFTFLNQTESDVSSIWLSYNLFMPALKVFDSANNELAVFSNSLTRSFLEDRIQSNPRTTVAENARITLEKLNKKEAFIIWIKLVESLKKGDLRIIRLHYKDNTDPEVKSFKNNVFSIPEYIDEYISPKKNPFDLFYIITAPEDNIIDFQITKSVVKTRKFGKTINVFEERKLTQDDGFYINSHEHMVSIRVPPLEDQTNFEIKYMIVPFPNEVLFFTVSIYSLIAVSIIFSLVSIGIIDSAWAFFLNPIKQHINTLLGGIVTASLVGMSILNKPIINKFWFTIPILASAIGFLLQNLIK